MITGNWATLLLPIEDGEINYPALGDQIDYFIESDVDGIYSNGTAGEFYTQSDEEYKNISKLLAHKCRLANLPFQIGASHCHPQEQIERIKFAASLNPTAIQVILPDWFPCSTEVALTFLKEADKVSGDVPIILYNPPHAKVNLTADQLKKVFDEVDGLVGFKLPRLTDDIEATGLAKEASIFVAGHFLATDAHKGAKGAYSNVCCLGPKAAQKWTDDCMALKPKALELEKRIQEFMNTEIAPYITEAGYSNAAVDKLMAAMGDWNTLSTEMRFPYPSIPVEDIEKKVLARNQIIPEFEIG
ncbi:dihydrodipicolinate synthase family protein [Vibrio splendidus]